MFNITLRFFSDLFNRTETSSPNIHPIDKNYLAIGGYDLVSYFDGKPLKGDCAFMDLHLGIRYQFVSYQNLEKFRADREKYLPQCAGHCALGVVRGYKARINPQTFKIIDHKLYLFFNGVHQRKHLNALALWEQNEEDNLKVLPTKWMQLNRR
ncbi:MAG: YHS domain-containing (seleno)protein [Cyclobacteriaceae bacterium]|jgi:hypothetical protein|nr:YHS domain protein [Flammeovirgaceae bacterium]